MDSTKIASLQHTALYLSITEQLNRFKYGSNIGRFLIYLRT